MRYRDAKDLYKAEKRANKYAQRADKKRYGKPGGGIFGFLVLIVCLGFYLLTHAFAWIMIGIIGLALLAVVWQVVRSGMLTSRMQNYQQPPIPQQPPQNYQPYQPYQQGYQPEPQEFYQEGGRHYPQQTQQPHYPPQEYSDYNEMKAQYPEQHTPPVRW